MKLYLLTALTLLVASCARFKKLDGNYYSNQQDCLSFDYNTGAIETKDSGVFKGLQLKQRPNKLKFREVRYSGRGMFRRRTERYNFKLVYKSGDSIITTPVSALAKKLFKNRKDIVFKSKYLFADKTNYFDRIIFHSSRCFGICNDLYMELDRAGNLKVTNKGNDRIDSGKVNLNYRGKVSYYDIQRLNEILSYSQLKTLEWPDRKCFDAPEYTVILYQNDRRYYFHGSSVCIPIVSYELTNYLFRFFCYDNLREVKETFEYER